MALNKTCVNPGSLIEEWLCNDAPTNIVAAASIVPVTNDMAIGAGTNFATDSNGNYMIGGRFGKTVSFPLTGTGPYSIEYLALDDGTTTGITGFFQVISGVDVGIVLYRANATGAISVECDHDGSTFIGITGPAAGGVLRHIVLTFDSSNLATLYVDGASVGTPATLTGGRADSTTDPCYMACNGTIPSGSLIYPGKTYLSRIYSAALSSAQVSAQYASILAGPPSSSSSSSSSSATSSSSMSSSASSSVSPSSGVRVCGYLI